MSAEETRNTYRRWSNVRSWLKGCELWKQFCVAYDEMQAATPGIEPREAKERALDEVYPGWRDLLPEIEGGAEDEDEEPEGAVPVGERLQSDLPKHFFSSKKAFENKPEIPMRDSVEWVFNNLLFHDVRPKDAPSAGAWAMLVMVRRSYKSLDDFYRTLATKLMRTKGEVDGDDLERSSDRNLDATIQKLQRLGHAALPPGPEGFQAQPEMEE